MKTRDFRTDLLERRPFGEAAEKRFHEEWNQMTDEEKLRFMDKRMASMVNPEDRFSIEAADSHHEEWRGMTPEEQKAFVKKQEEAFHHRMEHTACFAGRM